MKMQATRYLSNVRPEAHDIDMIYKDKIREFGIEAAQFPKKVDAEKAENAIKAGKDFSAVVGAAIKKQVAFGNINTTFYKREDLLPQVFFAIVGMKEGQVSPLISMGKGCIILKLTGFRYPDNPDARKAAEEQAYQAKRNEAYDAYVDGLIKKEIKQEQSTPEKLGKYGLHSKAV